MPTVAELIKGKGGTVATISPKSTVLDAAELMNTHHIGSLVVVDGDSVAGIITERDVMTKIVATQRDPAKTAVGSVMTSPIVACSTHTTIEELRQVMREKRIRHVPVVESGKLMGIVSIGDLNRVENRVMSETIQYLEQYMYRG